jgi:RHS repeat-associated protein
VDLVVSLGPPPVGTVPSVLGLSQSGAQADIGAAGFLLGAVGGQFNAAVPPGVVVSQDPAAGTAAPAGSLVSLVTSLGVPPGDIDADGDGVTGNQGDCDDTNPDIRPGAVDIAGDGVDQNCNGRDSIAGDDTPPTVAIDAPAETTVVTLATDVIGTATDAAFLRYTLARAPVNSAEVTTLASGTSPVVAGVLGRLDPTLLENGLYRLRLTAEDVNGQVAVAEQVVQVNGAKVGHARLSFLDLEVPVAGIPIRIVRTYDSRVTAQRDFGVGWSLDVRQGAYQHNRAPGLGWQIVESPGPLGLPCQTARETLFHVTQIWLSDREVYTFKPRLANLAAVVGGCVADVRFEFLDGTTPGARLDVLGNTQVLYTSGHDVRDFGGGEDTGLVYDPPLVRLTTRDRRVIDLDRAAGIVRIQDANANALTIGEGGIVHSSGKGIAFQRDPEGRITRITDPAGDTLHYTYDASGDLATLTTRTGTIVTHTYDDSHRLATIVDGLGHVLFRAEYDDQGRLRATQDADGGRIELAHDLDAARSTLVNRAGDTTVYQYDERGNVVRVVDGLGHPTTLAYGPFDTLLSTVDALGNTSVSTYDDQGNLLTRRDPLGHVTSYTYDAHGQVLTSTDALGRTTTHTYDARGNRLSTAGPDGDVWRAVYDAQGNLLRSIDPAGHASTFAYDVFGRLTRETTPCGGEARYQYDALGRRVRVLVIRTLASGNREEIVTGHTYDVEGRPIRTTNHDGLFVSREFDATGNLRATVDRLGRRTAYTYTPAGRLAGITFPDGGRQTHAYDAAGRLTRSTDPSDRTVTHVYDALGQETSVIASDGATTTITYDAAGRLLTETDALGRATSYAYDAAGRPISATDPLGRVTRYTYDAVGNLSSATDANGRVTAYEYDADNRRTRVVHPDGTSTRFTYDFAGRVTSTTDQANLTTAYGYDACGRLVSVTDALGRTTAYTYDDRGDRLSQTDPAGRITTWAYDAFRRPVRRTLPLGMSEAFAYDAVGNTIARTDFGGRTTSFAYDAANRLATKSFPDGSAVSFTYTPTGDRLTARDARGTTTYRHDTAGRVLEIVHPDGTPISYAYDAAGNRITVNVPSGTTTFDYDALNRVAAVIEPDGARTSYRYDPVGNLLGVDYPNGVHTERTYDTLNRLVTVETRGPGDSLVSAYTYTLGPIGNRVQVTEQDGRTVSYGYDALYRLVQERITGPGLGDRTIGYAYDLAGNRTARTDSAGGPTTYSYDANDRLVSENGGAFTYDAEGNLLTQPDGRRYRYDAESRLIEAETPARVVTYTYDADGARVRSSAGGAVTTYLVDTHRQHSQVLEERDGTGALLAANVFGGDLIRRQQGATRAYHHADGQRSVRHLTDPDGLVTDRYTYDAFGVLLNHTGSSANPYLYAGEQLDPRLGEYYLRARYYQPGRGRFSTMDPVAPVATDPRSLNRYVYAFSDPVNRRDPSGEFGLAEAMISVSISGILAQLSLPGVAPAEVPILHVDYSEVETFQDPHTKGGRYQDVGRILLGAIQQARQDFVDYNVKVLGWHSAQARSAVTAAAWSPGSVEAKVLEKTISIIPANLTGCSDHAWGCAPVEGARGFIFLSDHLNEVRPAQLRPPAWKGHPDDGMGVLLGNSISHEAGHLYGIKHPPAARGIMDPGTNCGVRCKIRGRYWDRPSKDVLERVLGLKP